MAKSKTRGNGSLTSVHLVLQGETGAGKSSVSSILAQYFRTKLALVHSGGSELTRSNSKCSSRGCPLVKVCSL